MKHKATIGDVFLISIDGSRFGVGQVAGDWNGELYIVVYDVILPSAEFDLARVASDELLFAALSLDAKIHHGDWRIIGNVTSNLDRIPQPAFKVNQDGKVWVETRDRSRFWPASKAQAEGLRYRTVVAPVRLENALRALHGIGEWNPKFDELRADYAFASARLVKK